MNPVSDGVLEDGLRELLTLGLRVINQGLSLRRALDNQTPHQFEGALAAYVKYDSAIIPIHIELGGGWGDLWEPPGGEFRNDGDRVDWIRSRMTVVRELGSLDYDADAFQRGAYAVVSRLGGAEKIADPSTRAEYLAVTDEVESLRKWTRIADQFARGYIKPAGRGSSIVATVQDIIDRLNLNIALPAAAGAFALVLVLGLVVALLALRK